MFWVMKHLAELGVYYKMVHGIICILVMSWRGRIMTQESTRSCIQTFLKNFNLFEDVHVNIRTQHFLLNLSVSKELCPAPFE